MPQQTKKTDNHALGDKVKQRVRALLSGGKKNYNVLDAYHGRGSVWAAVKREVEGQGISLSVVGIDRRSDVSGVIKGDNHKIISAMDLSRFNVIDLDAYGIPYDNLQTIFLGGFNGIVFVTFIQTGAGRLNTALKNISGLPSGCGCETVFSKAGWSLFKKYLAENGVDEISVKDASGGQSRRHYLWFQTSGAAVPEAG